MIEGVFTKEFSRNKNDKAGVSISKGYCKDQRKRCVTERRNPAIVRMLEVAVGRLPMIKAGNFTLQLKRQDQLQHGMGF